MSKSYRISGVGRSYGSDLNVGAHATRELSPLKFSVCITYKLAGDEDNSQLVTNFYVNSGFVAPVADGKVNKGFEYIYQTKPDALSEYNYFFYVNSNMPGDSNVYDSYHFGRLVDFQ